jgi:amino acid permease
MSKHMDSDVQSAMACESAPTDHDVEEGRVGVPSRELSRVLKSRHMQMIAICGQHF